MAKKKTKKAEVVASATLKNVRVSPQKTRLVLDMVKNLQVESALNSLRFSKQKRAKLLEQLLLSAINNAKENHDADVDSLWVVGGWVDEGRKLMRYRPRARGSAFPIRKRSSHVTIEVGYL